MALVDAATIVMGTSMVLAGPHPMTVNVAYLAAILRPKAKFASLLGSYGWGGKLFDLIAQILTPLKLDIIEPLQIKGKPKEEDFKKLDEMAESSTKNTNQSELYNNKMRADKKSALNICNIS